MTPRRTLRIITSGALTPSENMALDEALLDLADAPVLRLYRWQPVGLSLGYFQKDADPAVVAALGDEPHEVVRRLTGGGAIVHAHELTYALAGPDGVAPFEGPVDRSYRIVHDVLRDVLCELGVNAFYPADAPAVLKRHERPFLCFDRGTALDLFTEHGKLVGSAKRRRNGRALQHGSIILERHPAQPKTAAVADHVDLDADSLAGIISERLAAALEMRAAPVAPSPDESTRAETIANDIARRRGRDPGSVDSGPPLP